MTDLNYVKEKKNRFLVPLKVGSRSNSSFKFIPPDLLLLHFFSVLGGPLEWSCGKLQLLASVKSF